MPTTLIIFGLNDIKKIFKNLFQNLRKVADKNKAMNLKNRKLPMS
ncbi:S-adenosylmethionine: 2-demethylmenaquinone methyltransferase [Streptococcus sanguinis]|uniref:S-adenosylmethionine: 2-demethylmenaquinone methyltransferase n=1 Tax=Streptococcus sanguinis TaxID=1305 RepID=A0A7H8V328_STRSA|nr:S-adenosylmethionine: 2-demethylmenaquinone methyltransferase [Streptococcus sanguinis]